MLVIIRKFSFSFLIILFFSTNIFSIELNLLCSQNTPALSKNIYPRDLIIRINTESNTVDIGGLTINAENLEVTESNIRWSEVRNDNMFGNNDAGLSSGLLGRFSGILSLEFTKLSTFSKSGFNYQCEDFKIKNRKF